MRIAFVHDFLTQYGGAERLLETVISFFPHDECDIYTLSYDSDAFPLSWKSLAITPIASALPYIDRYPQLYAPYLMACIESLDLSHYDIVISSDLIFAKCIIAPVGCVHVSYLHTPASMLYPIHGGASSHGIFGYLTLPMKSFIRMKEYAAVHRVDRLLTNSQTSALRIATYFHRDAEVVYSFVSVPDQQAYLRTYTAAGEYYLCISRLVPDKRLDLAVRACTELGKRLIVLGQGEQLHQLMNLAGPTIEFRGFVSDSEKAELIGKCSALIVPGCEDFGLTPLETMSLGKPVIAFGQGGVTETVIPHVTGLFFPEQSVASLQTALLAFDQISFDPEQCRNQALRFSLDLFGQKIKSIVDEAIQTR